MDKLFVGPLDPPTTSNPTSEPNPTETSSDEEETKHFTKILTAFQQYKSNSLFHLQKRIKDFLKLPIEHQQLLNQIVLGGMVEGKFGEVRRRIEENEVFVKLVVEEHLGMDEGDGESGCGGHDHGHGHGHSHSHTEQHSHSHSHIQPTPTENITESEMEKVRSTIRQCVRDWSIEGEPERKASYQPILTRLEHEYSTTPIPERGNIQILVPGAGLGRLVYEIVKKGFSCQGNEFSFYMILASHFILNRVSSLMPTGTEPRIPIYPYIHSLSNHTSTRNILQPVYIPDEIPSAATIPETADFSMVAGDFVQVYGKADSGYANYFDIVATCFFIDTAKNVLEYLDTIKKILKPGGLWINNGPLLYHFENTDERSIELSLEELVAVMTSDRYGFVMEGLEFVESPYSSDRNSMLQYRYKCATWACRMPMDNTNV